MSASRLKVMIIDDEPPIRKLLRMGLTTQGYEILDAPNGKTALALLGSKPDLVILDLGLPDIGGPDLLAMIRARNDAVPIIVLSSRGDEGGKVKALDLGADDYLTKPFGMEDFWPAFGRRCAISSRCRASGRRSGPATSWSISSAASSRWATRRSSCRPRNTSCCASSSSTPARC